MIFGLVGKKDDPGQLTELKAVYDVLLARGHSALVEADAANAWNEAPIELNYGRIQETDFLDIGLKADIVIVFGGDGTMLHAARSLARFNVPLIGVNQGRLGFITDIPKATSPEVIINLLEQKRYTAEPRTFLETYLGGKHSLALNDIVIQRVTGKILEFRVYINEEFAYQARGDGLIISTPTGSTAYAMAAGGPIIHPASRVIELVPMFPQTLSCRPLIIPDDANITFKLISGNCNVYADGTEIEAEKIDVVEIGLSKKQVKFLHPNVDEVTYSYYNTLREKLNWHINC